MIGSDGSQREARELSLVETLMERATALAEAQGHALTEKWVRPSPRNSQYTRACRRCDLSLVVDGGPNVPDPLRIRGAAGKQPCARNRAERVLLKDLAEELKATQRAVTQWLEGERLKGRVSLMVERGKGREPWVTTETAAVLRTEFHAGAVPSKWQQFHAAQERGKR
jgi:hypothetical protein